MVGSIKKNLLFFFLIFLLTIIVFGNALPNKLFYDDEELIYKNTYIQNPHLWPRLFFSNMIEGAGKVSNMYRPVLMLTFGIDYFFWRSNSIGFHFTNIIIHALNGFLIFVLLENIFKKRWLSFLTTVFFIIHPVQTEAVTYASGRTDPLFTFFILSGLVFFNQFLKNKARTLFYFASLLCFILGLLSKESAIIFVPLLYLLFIVDAKQFDRKLFSQMVVFTLPFILLSCVYLLLRISIFNFSNTLNFYSVQNLYSSNILVRIYTFSLAFWEYVKIIFWPHDLMNYREVRPILHWYDWHFLSFFTFFAVGLFYLLKKFSTRKLWFFSFIWFFIGLLPASGIVPINNIIAEHYLYFPSVGFFLFFVSLFLNLLEKFKKSSVKYILFFVLFVIIFLLGIRTIIRNKDWQDPITFYSKTLQKTPNHVPMRNNLGMAYAEQGKLGLAEKEYKKALKINNYYPQTHHNLANIYLSQKKYQEAESEYIQALRIDPLFLFSLEALKNLYRKQNQTEVQINDKLQKIFKEYEH